MRRRGKPERARASLEYVVRTLCSAYEVPSGAHTQRQPEDGAELAELELW